MEFFSKAKAVKLRSHHNKYLVADGDQVTVRQSRNGGNKKARWLVEPVDGDANVIRLKSFHGLYLTASNKPFLIGMTGNKVLQTRPENLRDMSIEWRPERDGFQVKLMTFGGTFLRANGGTPPWRNSVTHDNPEVTSTRNWVLWGVEAVDVPEDEEVTDHLSMVSSFSSVSDDLFGSEIGSPVSVKSNLSPMVSIKKSGMDLFFNAKAVRLRSHHDKYLHADDDEESVSQVRNGSSKNARWSVEFVSDGGGDTVLRLKSCYGKYLTASNHPFLLGMTGRKVLQTLPAGRLDSSLEWEPVREGTRVRLRTRYGHFLRANGGLPPWRNSVTHDVPQRTATQDWILWEVHVVEIVVRSPRPNPDVQPDPVSESAASESTSPSFRSAKSSTNFGRQESSDSLASSPPKAADGRAIYYSIADEFGNVDEGVEGDFITFTGNSVDELTRRLEDETGLEDIIVCSRSPLNGKLYPLRLQLPPNKNTLHFVVIQSSSKGFGSFALCSAC
ncbi:NADPH-dependent diflavin oxidoreductase [Actinidia chinensis var. chinensis]|uniref:NADPH-dependent diflavin oxidoreductase n=1 Tax=Actinidia chinensis var. chinensis TaxID=1590841 RepID=A0A2R6QQZ8_ACTCC|nr:NADPH-dependent diflavin oxidoreductase [Actinidia chinensis var. chinensis]